MIKNIQFFNSTLLIELFFVFQPKEILKKINIINKYSTYTLKELMTFVLWGRENNKVSSRELADWCNNNDETCKLVLNSKKPSKSTINNFLNDYSFIFDLFDQFLIDLAMALGLIDGEILYGDGTILKAWFNTIKSILNTNYIIYICIILYNFHTIKSILNLKTDNINILSVLGFPYY